MPQDTRVPPPARPSTRGFVLAGVHPIHRIGLGAMRLTGQPGNWGPYADWQGGIRLLRRAVDLGVNLIDTARSYGAGWNERLIAEALAPYPAHLVIATKGGIEKVAPGQVEVDARPQSLRRHVEDALSNLHTERIDLFQLHRPDPAVPLAESIGALQAMQAEGKLRWIGVSNVDLAQLQLARSIAVIVSVQNRCNQLDAPDDVVLDYCTREGLAYVTHGPLAAHAQRHGAPLAATGRSAPSALRRLLERAPNVAIIPGTTSIAHLEENLRAWDAPA